MNQTRHLAAILAADLAGYSRLMGADEEGTLERLKALRRELLDPKIAAHRGGPAKRGAIRGKFEHHLSESLSARFPANDVYLPSPPAGRGERVG